QQHRSLVVLQGAGDELRLARRTAVDQRDDWLAIGNIARGGGDPFDAVALAALDDGDVALVDERVGRGDRHFETAAGVVAQVEDQADELVARLCAQILDRSVEHCRRAILKGGQPNVANVARFEPGGDGGERPTGTLYLDFGGSGVPRRIISATSLPT